MHLGGSEVTNGCLASSKAADAALTRTLISAIFALLETQRLVASGKTCTCSSVWPRKGKCGTVDPVGEIATLFDLTFLIY